MKCKTKDKIIFQNVLLSVIKSGISDSDVYFSRDGLSFNFKDSFF